MTFLTSFYYIIFLINLLTFSYYIFELKYYIKLSFFYSLFNSIFLN